MRRLAESVYVHPDLKGYLVDLIHATRSHPGLLCGGGWNLISPCQRESLANACQRLCRLSPGSQWILPCRPGEPIRLEEAGSKTPEHLYPWEVPYAPSNRFQKNG